MTDAAVLLENFVDATQSHSVKLHSIFAVSRSGNEACARATSTMTEIYKAEADKHTALLLTKRKHVLITVFVRVLYTALRVHLSCIWAPVFKLES